MSNNIFLAGAAREDTTPAVGTLLYGYSPHQVSTAIHDPLSVTALAVSQNGKIALLITAEIGDINTELCHELAEKLSEECKIPKQHILISSSHTHSAPNLSGVVGWGELDTNYYENIFLPAVLKAAKEALDALMPAEIAVGVTQSEVGINRREQYINGEIGLGQNPHGCYDPNMTVISIRNSESKGGILNLIHYGCHGTCTGYSNEEISRDWSGIMIDRVETETNTLTAFWNGAVGDVGPRLSNGQTAGSIQLMEELGAVAAADAMRAYRAKGGYHAGKLEIFTDTVKLPRKEMPSLEQVEKKLAEYSEPEKLDNIFRLEYEYYKETYEYLMSGSNEKPDDFTFEQTVISFGDALFVPFPFEPFSEIVMRLREYSPYPYTLCLSCTNGYNLYLPSEDQLCRGGYEVGCFLYGNLFPLANNTDQHIINENLRILRENGKMN